MSRWWTAIAGILFLPGCVIVQVSAGNPIPGLSTVAVAPFFNLSAEPERVADGRRMALAYYAELQKTPGFQVIPVGVAEQAIRENNLRMDSPDDALALCRILDCDAVVVGAITDYEPYFPPRVGLQIAWYSPYPWAFQPGMPIDPCARDAIRYADEDATKARIRQRASEGRAWVRSHVPGVPSFGRPSCDSSSGACDVPPIECVSPTPACAPSTPAPAAWSTPSSALVPHLPARLPASTDSIRSHQDESGTPPPVFRGQSDGVLSVRTNLPASLSMPPPDPGPVTGRRLTPAAPRRAQEPALTTPPMPGDRLVAPATRVEESDEVPEGPWLSAAEIEERSSRILVQDASVRETPRPVIGGNAAGTASMRTAAVVPNVRRASEADDVPEAPPPLTPLKRRPPADSVRRTAESRDAPSSAAPPVPQLQPASPLQPVPPVPQPPPVVVETLAGPWIDGFDPRRPLMSYTRMFDARDPAVMAALRDWLELAGDRRSGGWQATLYRSEDFIRFCSQRMVIEMLTLHGGESRRRVVLKFRHYREP